MRHVIIIMLVLLSLFFSPISSVMFEKKVMSGETPTASDRYGTGYTMGKKLAETHGYYKGDGYIESECTAFWTEYIGDVPTSILGSMFISGCQDGYKSYFGK